MNTSNIDEIVDRYSIHQAKCYPKGTVARRGLKKRLRQAIQQELLKARIDELNRYDTDEDMYKTLRTVYLQAKLKGDDK